MKIKLRELIEKYYSFLFILYGFIQETAKYEHLDFGNEYVLLRSSQIYIQFLRERGHYYVSISRNMNNLNWFDFSDVLMLLGVDIDRNIGCLDKMKIYSRILAEKIDEITLLFSEEKYADTKAELEVIETKRAEERFGKW